MLRWEEKIFQHTGMAVLKKVDRNTGGQVRVGDGEDLEKLTFSYPLTSNATPGNVPKRIEYI